MNLHNHSNDTLVLAKAKHKRTFLMSLDVKLCHSSSHGGSSALPLPSSVIPFCPFNVVFARYPSFASIAGTHSLEARYLSLLVEATTNLETK